MHGQTYQALSARAAAFHERFVQALATGGGAYAAAEAASVSPLQSALDLLNAPTQALLGRPLSPINGRPSSAWVGALITPSTICSAAAASAEAYAPAPVLKACTNRWW